MGKVTFIHGIAVHIMFSNNGNWKRSNARPDITGDLLTMASYLKSKVLHCLHLDGTISCYLVKVSSFHSSDSTTADFFSHSNGQKSLAPGKRHSNVWRRMNRISSVTINQVDNLQSSGNIEHLPHSWQEGCCSRALALTLVILVNWHVLLLLQQLGELLEPLGEGDAVHVDDEGVHQLPVAVVQVAHNQPEVDVAAQLLRLELRQRSHLSIEYEPSHHWQESLTRGYM